jgi:cobalt-zinc-cadmium efflux system protein
VGHEHRHAPRAGEKRRLRAALLLTAVTMVAEFAGGYYTRSLALLGDAVHMLTHLLSLGLSYAAIVIALRPAPPEKTWRYWRVEILAGLLNGLALLPAAAYVLYESVERLRNPVEIHAVGTLVVGGVGLLVNVVCAALLYDPARHDLNLRGAFLHMLADGLSSVGVLAAGVAVMVWDWRAADPIVAALLSVLILGWCVSLLRASLSILLEAAPPHVRLDEVKAALEAVPGVREVHDLHVWTITSRMHSLTAHVALREDGPVSGSGRIAREIEALLRARWDINHATLQFEAGEPEGAGCAPEHHPAHEEPR